MLDIQVLEQTSYKEAIPLIDQAVKEHGPFMGECCALLCHSLVMTD